MPAAPEFFQAMGKVRAFEIIRQFYAEKQRTPDGNIRIARKITVNLYGKQEGGYGENKAYIAVRTAIDRIHGRGDQACHYQFFKISHSHLFQAIGCPGGIESAGGAYLRQQPAAPSDGA